LSELGMGQSATRGFSRFMLAGASDIEVDGAGRVLIPEYLKEFAKLEGTVIIAGVASRVEVWNEKAWGTYKRHIEKEADTLAENLGSIGAI
jgi:MraZ protein